MTSSFEQSDVYPATGSYFLLTNDVVPPQGSSNHILTILLNRYCSLIAPYHCTDEHDRTSHL